MLMNPSRRRVFDERVAATRSVAEPLRPRTTTASTSREPQPAGVRTQFSLREAQAAYHPSFEELFDRFWSNFALLTRPKAERIESLTIEIPISREEAYQGGQARIMIPARAKCPTCSGHGVLGPYECWHCQGHGAITADYPIDIAYPAGMVGQHTVQLSLNQFGINNFYLTVCFRVTGED